MSAVSIYQTRFGPMLHFTADQGIGRSLSVYGQWAFDEIALLYKILKLSNQGDFIDLGANVGTHTVPIGKLFPQCEVYAFEAQERAGRILSANTLINGLINTRVFHYLVGDTTKLVWTTSTSDIMSDNLGAVSFRVLEERDSVADAACLMQAAVDDIYPHERNVACIKADLEGMEFVAFLGARKTIERCTPAIYFEQHGNTVSAPIFDFMTRLGYELYWHVNFPFDTENIRGEIHNIFGPTVEQNVLCLHKSSSDIQWFAERMIPVSETFSDRVMAASSVLNAQLRSELRDAVKTITSTDLMLDMQKQPA